MFTNTQLRIQGSGVLGMMTDPNGDPMTALLHTAPQHGALQLNACGSFTYTPFDNYAGMDTFKFVASDGQAQSQPVTVNLQVSQLQLLLRVDSNNNQTVDADDDLAPQTPGKLVLATVPADPEIPDDQPFYDLAELRTGLNPGYAAGVDMSALRSHLTLVSGHARLWTSTARTTELQFGQVYPVIGPNTLPSTLYIEVTEPGAVQIEMSVEDSFLQGKKAADKAAAVQGLAHTVPKTLKGGFEIRPTYVVDTSLIAGTDAQKAEAIVASAIAAFGKGMGNGEVGGENADNPNWVQDNVWGQQQPVTISDTALPLVGWIMTPNVDANFLQGAGGIAGYIMAWQISADTLPGTDGKAISFTSSKFRFMAFRAAWVTQPARDLFVGEVKMTGVPATSAIHEEWHTNGIPGGFYNDVETESLNKVANGTATFTERFYNYGIPEPEDPTGGLTLHPKRPGYMARALRLASDTIKAMKTTRLPFVAPPWNETPIQIARGIMISNLVGDFRRDDITDAGSWHGGAQGGSYLYSDFNQFSPP